METSRSRRFDRHRSPYGSRSHSRSPKDRRLRRSSSRNRYRSELSPRHRKSPHGSRIRNHSISPIRITPPHSHYLKTMTIKPDGRLKRPEIQSSTVCLVNDNQIETNVLSSAQPNASTLTLTERFSRLTSSGTALYNSRQFVGGRPRGDTRQLPHLIITNNSPLPPATLVRQAKTISVVVERKFPTGKRRLTDYPPSSDVILIPRHPNEGLRPVFDRPEIKFYQSPTEEWQIFNRLLDCVSSNSRSQRHESEIGGNYRDHAIIGSGRFYGSRVDDANTNSRSARSLDPLETPRNPAYFLHDTRDDANLSSRRYWRTRFPNMATGYRREYRDRRSPGSPERSHAPPVSSPTTEVAERWTHDKFEQLEREEKGVKTVDSEKSVPKPVPAPKPILWSTIGKEIVNGETQATNKAAHPQSTALSRSPMTKDTISHHTEQAMDDGEDVRIDVEPVLADEN